jgi:hypothetical protein
MADQVADSGAGKKSVIEPVDLEEPIVRGELTISRVDVRRPGTGEMRGLSMLDMRNLEVSAMLELLPRVTVPPLLPHELEEMNPRDFFVLAVLVAGFLLPKAVRPASPQQ